MVGGRGLPRKICRGPIFHFKHQTPRPRTPMVGGAAYPEKSAGAPIFHFKHQTIVATALRCARFQVAAN